MLERLSQIKELVYPRVLVLVTHFSYPSVGASRDKLIRFIEQFGKKNSVAVFNPTAYIRGKTLYLDSNHYTRRGHHKFAKKITSFLKKL
mgnify:CR=1 FL=1